MRVAIANVLPWNRGWPTTEGPIDRLNELIAALAREEGVPILPFYETLESPEAAGRNARRVHVPDGDHPSVEGYRRLGELCVRTCPPSRAAGSLHAGVCLGEDLCGDRRR